MRRLPQNISLLAVSVLTVGAVSVVPVYARSATSGSDDSTRVSAVAATTDDETATGGGISHSTGTTGAGVDSKHSGDLAEVRGTGNVKELRSRAQELLTTDRQDKKHTSVQERQKACELHKGEIVKRQQNYVRNATKHLDTFTGIYNKVLAYQTDKKLTAANFDQLKSDADAKKAVATAAVAALSDASVNVDCSSSDPASAVATLKTAVANARTSLQDYRSAIKDVIVALQSAKSAANTGGTANTEAN